ncbi:transcription initiation factor TFIID subunit 8 [Striga asiatica]|uniref:Transcription initiation factor TFIID subunit 8 n=1 Tax=Striga asiatica TaxID=4170 RepID=A0A5A7QEB5_STRAF|nr:transcription initiation factor TFIID subunit 8 [Striga asiatica]
MARPVEGPDPPSESEFSYRLARVAVAQTCQSMGFTGAQNSALCLLTDVATRYLRSAAKLAAASADLGGRTQTNLADIIAALEDLASVQGFRGLSSVRSVSLFSSAVFKDLIRFVKFTDEIPFARPLPPRRIFFPGRKRKFGGYYCDEGRWRHVPAWLPPAEAAAGRPAVEKTRNEAKWEESVDTNRDSNSRVRLSNSSILKGGGKVRFKLGVAMKNPNVCKKTRVLI